MKYNSEFWAALMIFAAGIMVGVSIGKLVWA